MTIHGTATTGPGTTPGGLIPFYWHFVRQTKGWYALMFVTSLGVALIDTVIHAAHWPARIADGGGRPAGGARAAVADARRR